eukprot:gi/632948985/ref/XP_007889898.1/ PREDICTED: piggyBac transposable element-derived protein 4-like isoform X2 [Callorhinchus milii]
MEAGTSGESAPGINHLFIASSGEYCIKVYDDESERYSVLQVSDDESDITDISTEDPDSELNDTGSSDQGWSNSFTPIQINDFCGEAGVLFPRDFDISEATPLDYFSLFLHSNLFSDFVEHTNSYARWKMGHEGAADARWVDVSEVEMRCYIGLNVLMGINQLPNYKLYWSRDNLFGNDGVKSIMTCNRYEKLTEYFHVSDRLYDTSGHDSNFDALYKARPLLDTVRASFKKLYRPSRYLSVDEAMIAMNGKLTFKQHMPPKLNKGGVKVWMLSDAENAYLLDFEVFHGRRGVKTSKNGLRYEAVRKLTKELEGQNHCVFFDSFFTCEKLMMDLLDAGIYSCGMAQPNHKGFPKDLQQLTKMKRGEYRVQQKGHLTAILWQDTKQVAMMSTLSDPMEEMLIQRRQGQEVIEVRQPHSIYVFNKYMNGVDRYGPLRAHYQVGRPGKEHWKNITWFVINCAILNAFILYKETSIRVNKKKNYSHLDFRCELVRQLIGGYSSRKRRSVPMDDNFVLHRNVVMGHESVHMGYKRRCKVHLQKKVRKETVYGCKICNIHLCKDGCHFQYHK